MTTRTFALLPWVTASLVLGMTGAAYADVLVSPPRPNVLLAVDTSGSMEYKANVEGIEETACSLDNTSDKSRWIGLVEALTGNITDYDCVSVDRSSAAFRSEYRVAGVDSADFLYTLPYHRPVSGSCTPTPDAVNNNIGYRDVGTGAACATPFVQQQDGLIDAFSTQLRFGLATFDPLTSADTGPAGTYSYFYPNTAPAEGGPLACTAEHAYEVGIRNASAPPWEGGLVAFGPPDASSTELKEISDQIQKNLLSLRPFGSTPIAGMLSDIRDFYWKDPDPDGSGHTAPKDDLYSQGGCRENYVILLTDGEPNMDLRPDCEGASTTCDGDPGDNPCCPYDTPEDIALALSEGADGNIPVKVYVVGFAVSTVSVEGEPEPVDCRKLTGDPSNLSAQCENPPPHSGLEVCCTLQKIAFAGGSETAYFADNVTQLRASLNEIFARISRTTMSRTFPVLASGSASSSRAASFRFFTSYHPRVEGTGLPDGVIERQRYVCSGNLDPADTCDTATLDNEAVACKVNPNKGDDFVANINKVGSADRKFYTVLGATSGTEIFSAASIRPAANEPDDGFEVYTGTLETGAATALADKILPAAMAPMPRTDRCTGLTAEECRTRILEWVLGGADAGSTYNRCATPGSNCSLVSDIYHSTPALVSQPAEDLRDESYQRYAFDYATRPLMLYAASNDGLLHAYKVASNDPDDESAEAKVEAQTMNELWAFIPPAVLPRLADQYPSIRLPLLDGSPITREVPAVLATDVYRFERSASDFSTSDVEVTWRTVLVQGFGADRGGYYALDITDPVSGPRFLWQLTTNSSNAALFGDRSATPTITTLYFDPDDGLGAREIAVALLPGGDGGPAPDPAENVERGEPHPAGVDADFTPRTNVPWYRDVGTTIDRSAARRGRSLTVVRLDSGEIIRTFRRSASDAPASIASRVTATPLDSPITGQATAYPGWVGSVADRAFVGDRDGALWRVDLSASDPSAWNMTMLLDAYSQRGAHAGHAIATAPVISTDDLGRVVVAFATGDQDDFVGRADSEDFLFSVTEQLGFGTEESPGMQVESRVNWYSRFTKGERVAGPLTLLSSTLYFSTFLPASTDENVCSRGESRVGGMHYALVDGEADQTDPLSELSRGGRAALPKDLVATSSTLVQFVDGGLLVQDPTDNPLVFGVAIAQKPSCFKEETFTDSVFGGNHVRITNDSAAQYELVVQVGSSAGRTTTGGSTNVTTLALPTPDNSPIVNSWAAVME